MNRECIEKSTGKLISFQSGEETVLGTLTRNAIAAGYSEDDIEEKYTEDDIKTVLLNHETVDEKIKREAKEAKNKEINNDKKMLIEKYRNKDKSKIPEEDVIKWGRLKMYEEME